MKKLLISLVVASVAVAVYAADNKAPTDKPACCAKAKTEAKAECPFAKEGKAGACTMAGKDAAKDAAAKQALHSPKALADARK